MRSLVIVPDAGHYHLARLNALAQTGQQFEVLEIFDGSGFAEFQATGETDRRLTWHRLGLARGNFDAAGRDRIFRHLDRIAADAIVVPGWAEPWAHAAQSWALRRNVPAVLLSDSTAGDAKRRWWREVLKSRFVQGFSAALVGGSRHVRYVEQLGMARDRIFTGYDVVDNAHFATGAAMARADAARMRSRLGLPGRYMLGSARFVEKKNLTMLIDAYAAYRELAGEAALSLVLLGDGALRPVIEQQIEALRIGGAVQLAGFRRYDELPVFYGLADLFVHASLIEQWGLVVNEAMASGLPVIVSETCGCVPELIEEGGNGVSIDPCDPAGLAAVMLDLSLSDHKRQAMGRRSAELVASYSPATFASALSGAIQRACAEPRHVVPISSRTFVGAAVLR